MWMLCAGDLLGGNVCLAIARKFVAFGLIGFGNPRFHQAELGGSTLFSLIRRTLFPKIGHLALLEAVLI